MNTIKRVIENLDDLPEFENPNIITLDDYFMGRLDYDEHPAIRDNAQILLDKINKLFLHAPFVIKRRSGYRTPEINKNAGGSEKSTHLSGEGIDIADPNGTIKRWIKNNFVKVTELGLFQEHPSKTPTWVHLQTRPTKNNPFMP